MKPREGASRSCELGARKRARLQYRTSRSDGEPLTPRKVRPPRHVRGHLERHGHGRPRAQGTLDQVIQWNIFGGAFNLLAFNNTAARRYVLRLLSVTFPFDRLSPPKFRRCSARTLSPGRRRGRGLSLLDTAPSLLRRRGHARLQAAQAWTEATDSVPSGPLGFNSSGRANRF